MEAKILIAIHAHNGKFPHSEPMPGNTAYDYRGETMQDFIADLDLDQVDYCFISSAQALLEDMVEGNATTYADAALDSRLFAYTYYDPLRVEESLREIEWSAFSARMGSISPKQAAICWPGRLPEKSERRRLRRAEKALFLEENKGKDVRLP